MELYIIPAVQGARDDKYIIYRPLLGLAFVGNRKMAALAEEVLLEKNHLEIAIDSHRFLSDIGFLNPDPAPARKNRILSTAVLLLTNRCQLRCTYCYAAAGEAPPKSLSLQSGKAVIDFAYQQACEHQLNEFRVDFHGGGEPTVEWAKLQKLTRYARSKPISSKISLTSNGIWSAAQYEWIAENIDQVSFSMDGSPATQDRNRPLKNGQPSSWIVFRSLKYLDEHKATYGIRMTVRPPWHTLPVDLQYILENSGCRSVQVEPAFNLARGEHCPPGEDQVGFIDAFQEAYILARQYQARFSFSGARPELITDIFCASPYEAVVVNPDDQIVACYEITNAQHPFVEIAGFGRVAQGKVMMDWSARDRFKDLSQQRLETCKECFCRWHCAGDCFTRAFSTGEDGHLVKNLRCTINQSLTRFKLLDFISSGDGVWQKFKPANEGKYG